MDNIEKLLVGGIATIGIIAGLIMIVSCLLLMAICLVGI